MPRKIKTSPEELVHEPEGELTAQPRRGRKLKYESDDARRAARRLQNRAYRERKKQELINLRRAAANPVISEEQPKEEQVDAVPIEL